MAERCQTLVTVLVCAVSLCVPVRAQAQEEGAGRPLPITRQQLELRYKILKIVDEIHRDHHLRVRFEGLDKAKHQRSQLIFQEADAEDYGRMYRFLKILQEELRKYPPDFFKPRQLQTVFLVKALFNDDKNAQGIYDYRQKIIFFDFARQFGGELAQRHNIHHEFFHVIDTNSFYWQGKEEWEDLNKPDFRYAGKGKILINPQRNESNYFAPNQKGFVTYYAMMSPFEDKAEVFACLLVPSQHKLIRRWAEKDSILRKKITYIKEFLSTYTDGVVDEEYFSRLLTNQIP